MQYLVTPFLSWAFDQEGYFKSERLKQNQNMLLQTSVPAPRLYADIAKSGKVSPNQVYKHYEACFQGYQVPVQGIFTDPPAGLAAEDSTPRAAVINGKMWLFDREAPEFLDGGDIFSIVWSYIQNPFGLIKAGINYYGGLTDQQYRVERYHAYLDQRIVLIAAYRQVLQCPENVTIAIYPDRQGGSPTFTAVKDDYRRTGLPNFWNFSDPLVQVADRNMVAYAAKYQNFLATDWRSAAASIAVMVIQMIAQMGLTKLGTKFVSSHSSYIKGGKAPLLKGAEKLQSGVWGRLGNSGFLKEMGEEIFIEQGIFQSLGGFLEDLIQVGLESIGWEAPDDWLLPGWGIGDIIEWTAAFFSSRKGYIEQRTRIAMSLEVDSKSIGSEDVKVKEKEALPELLKKIIQKAQSDDKTYKDLKADIKAKDQAEFQKSRKKYVEKFAYEQFQKRNTDMPDKQIRRECKKIVKEMFADPKSDPTPRDIMTKLRDTLVTDQKLLDANADFDLKVTFKDGHSETFGRHSGSDILLKPISKLMTDANIKSIAFVDPIVDPADIVVSPTIKRAPPSPPTDNTKLAAEIGPGGKTTMRAPLDTQADALSFIAGGTKVTDPDIRKYLKDNFFDMPSGEITTEMQKALYDVGIQSVEDLRWASSHKVDPAFLKEMWLGNRRIEYFIRTENQLISMTDRIKDLNIEQDINKLTQSDVDYLKRRFDKVCQSLVETLGAVQMRMEYLKAVGTEINNHVLVSKGDIDITGVFGQGHYNLADGKFYRLGDIFQRVLMKPGMVDQFTKYVQAYQSEVSQTKRLPDGFSYYTTKENVDQLVKRLIDPTTGQGDLKAIKDMYRFDTLGIKSIVPGTDGKIILEGTYKDPLTQNPLAMQLTIASVGNVDFVAEQAIRVFQQMFQKAENKDIQKVFAGMTASTVKKLWSK